MHNFQLANSVTAILCLLIHRRIPISILEYHITCRCQIEAYTTTSSWGDERENVFIFVKLVYTLLSFVDFGWAVKSDLILSMDVQEFLEDV